MVEFKDVIPKPNPYVPHVEKFTNSHEFSYLAEVFNKTGFYTSALPGTYEYKTFWEDVKYKLLHGFTNSSGIHITGHHFFYLNFCRIELQNPETKKKFEGFPRFVDLDYDYFHMIQYCRINEKSFVCVKGRRQGYSFKAAAIVAHEFILYPKSRSIIGAFLSAYSQGTMDMVLANLNFLNANTEFRKQRSPDTPDYIMARYQIEVNKVKIWKGFHSVVQCFTFKDRPEAAVGKGCAWLVLDEAGIFPNITATYGFTEPLILDGSTYTGNALVFGSSGNMDSGSKYFHEMFIQPSKYNMLEFVEPDNEQKRIGYFSSAIKGRQGVCKNPNSKWFNQKMIDDDGNSNYEAAFDDLMFIREKAKIGNDPHALHGKITQYPLTWKEAFLRNKGAIFASPEMLEHLANVETSKKIQDSIEIGDLVFKENGTLEFQPNVNKNYITSFPLKSDEDNRGAIAIFERPEKENGQIPYGLYVGGNDPYDQDKSGVGSLGSFFIYKRFYKAGSTHDIIVAEYTGRPDKSDEYYENCRKLCMYYNCKVLYENQLTGLKVYFEQKNALHYMWEQPQIIKDIVKDSKVRRGYGIHMNRGTNGSSGIKDTCEIYVKDWLYTERDDIDGKKILNLHTIKSIALLKELIAYDMEGNYDRVVAFMLCILQTKELHRIHVDNMKNSSTNFSQDNFLKKLWIRKEGKSNHNFNFNKLN